MENIYEIGLLLDFYGQLLTERQYEILDLHYNSDFSLGEIAEHLGISRQGVYDSLRRGKTLLNNFEQVLGLLDNYFKIKSIVENIANIVDSININNLNEEEKEKLLEIKKYVSELKEAIKNGDI